MGRSNAFFCLSEIKPKKGWIKEDVKFEAISIMPVIVYERERFSFRKGSTAGSAP
jgi:hypothetical protein